MWKKKKKGLRSLVQVPSVLRDWFVVVVPCWLLQRQTRFVLVSF